MTGSRLSKRTRNFLLWTARLALVAYLVQISALDHWPAHPSDIVGIEGTSAHVLHCHGAGDCSDGGGASASLPADVTRLPVPPSPRLTLDLSPSLALTSIFIATPYEPPRAT